MFYTAATAGGVIEARGNALFATVVILSMALTPLLTIAADRLLQMEASMDGIDAARELKGAFSSLALVALARSRPRHFGKGRRAERHRQQPLTASAMQRDTGSRSISVTGTPRHAAPLRRERCRCNNDLRRRSQVGNADRGIGPARVSQAKLLVRSWRSWACGRADPRRGRLPDTRDGRVSLSDGRGRSAGAGLRRTGRCRGR